LDKELAKILERHRIKRFIGSRDFEIARCFSRPLKGLLNLVSAFPPLAEYLDIRRFAGCLLFSVQRRRDFAPRGLENDRRHRA